MSINISVINKTNEQLSIYIEFLMIVNIRLTEILTPCISYKFEFFPDLMSIFSIVSFLMHLRGKKKTGTCDLGRLSVIYLHKLLNL